MIKKLKPARVRYSKSGLIYDSNHSFYKYFCYKEKFNRLSLKPKHSFLVDLNKLNKINPQKIKNKREKNKYARQSFRIR